MFTKKPEKDGTAMEMNRPGMSPNRPNGPAQMPSTRPTASRSSSTGTASTIGADLSITGNWNPRARSRSKARCRATCTRPAIVIGEHARITGALVADEVVVRGTVQGSIRGNSVTFQANSHIEGDVFHQLAGDRAGRLSSRASRAASEDDPMYGADCTETNGMPPPWQWPRLASRRAAAGRVRDH